MFTLDPDILRHWFSRDDQHVTITTPLPVRTDFPYIYRVHHSEQAFLLKVYSHSDQDRLVRMARYCQQLVEHHLPVMLPIPASGQPIVVDAAGVYELFPLGTDLASFDFYANNLLAQDIATILLQLSTTNLKPFNKQQGLLPESFCQVLLRSLPADAIPMIFSLISMLRETLLPYEQDMETTLIHGDFHPGNLLLDFHQNLHLIDWEYSRRGVMLYDLAFFAGCLGVDSLHLLHSKFFQIILNTLRDKLRPSLLLTSRMVDLLLSIRLHWLKLWLDQRDQSAIDDELVYIRELLANRDSLRLYFMEQLLYQPTEKWIIADAQLSADMLHLRDQLASGAITLDRLRHTCDAMKCPVDDSIPRLLIAFGKEDRIHSIIDLVRITLRLIKDLPVRQAQPLFIALANASLDLGRHRQQRVMEHLIDHLELLTNREQPEEILLTIYSYILRNSFVMYDQLNHLAMPHLMLQKLRQLQQRYPLRSITEEYARVISNAITSALTRQQPASIPSFIDQLEVLLGVYPDSDKIKSALNVAKKNLHGGM